MIHRLDGVLLIRIASGPRSDVKVCQSAVDYGLCAGTARVTNILIITCNLLLLFLQAHCLLVRHAASYGFLEHFIF